MARKEIVFLILVNLLWGLIPLPASRLFADYSIFLIIFIRLIFAGAILLIITFIITWAHNHRQQKNIIQSEGGGTPITKINAPIFWTYLKAKNADFFNMKQYQYLIIVAIVGIDFQLITFFWGLKVLGTVITTIGYIVALIFVSIYNRIIGKESITGFKAIYLFILLVALVILGSAGMTEIGSSGSDSGSSISWGGISLALTYGAILAFFFISGGTDRMSQPEYMLIRKIPMYTTIRTFLKISLVFLIAAISLFPLLFIMQLIPLPSSASTEIGLFFSQLPQFWAVAGQSNTLILIIVCTIVPFLSYYLLAAIWPKNSSFELWAGVLAIVEPTVNIIIGVAILNELFPVPWLLIVIILLMVAIGIRYLYETDSQVQAFIFFKIAFGLNRPAMIAAYKMKAVRNVFDLLGEHDFMAEIIASSQAEFSKLIEKEIRKIPGLISYQIIMISQTEWDKTTPEIEKGYSITKRTQEEQLKHD